MRANKKTIVVTMITVIMMVTITLIGTYWHNHPTHYLYEDGWIIGKNADQIEQRYGSYDINWETIYGLQIKGYCVQTSTTDRWGDATWPEYYMIYFDENGKAYKVEIVVGGWGG